MGRVKLSFSPGVFSPSVIFSCGSTKHLTTSKVTPGNYHHTAFSKLASTAAVMQDLSIIFKTYFQSVVNRTLSVHDYFEKGLQDVTEKANQYL